MICSKNKTHLDQKEIFMLKNQKNNNNNNILFFLWVNGDYIYCEFAISFILFVFVIALVSSSWKEIVMQFFMFCLLTLIWGIE